MVFTVAQIDSQLATARKSRGKYSAKLKLLKDSISTLEQQRREARRMEKLDDPNGGNGNQGQGNQGQGNQVPGAQNGNGQGNQGDGNQGQGNQGPAPQNGAQDSDSDI